MSVQTLISDSGDELVVLSRRDYEVLLARSGDEAAEDRLSLEILARTGQPIDRGEDAALPEAVWEALERPGANAVAILRRFRGLSEAQLAQAAGMGVTDLRALEIGGTAPGAGARDALAQALRVPRELLAG